jgi:hypothetical protein
MLVVLAGTVASLMHLRQQRDQLAILRSVHDEEEKERTRSERPGNVRPVLTTRRLEDAQAVERLKAELARLKTEIPKLEEMLASDPRSAQIVAENRAMWARYQQLQNNPAVMEEKLHIENRMFELLSTGVRLYTQAHPDELPEGMTGLRDFITPDEKTFFYMNFDHEKFQIVNPEAKTRGTDLASTPWMRSKPLNEFEEVVTIFGDGHVEIAPQ